MAEIDDAELKQLTTAKVLLDKLLSPKTKRRAEKLVKEHYPDTVISEDLDPPEVRETREEIGKLSKKFDDYLEAQQRAKDDADTQAAFDRLKGGGYTDDGIDWIKNKMVERKIADPEAAAALYDKQHPPEPLKPAGFLPQGWGIGAPSKDNAIDSKRAYEDTDNYFDEEAFKILNEVRGNQAR